MRVDNSISRIGRIRELANQLIVKELERRGHAGLAPSHGDIISVLLYCGEGTMTEIAKHIHRDRSTVTTLVNKLIKLGYVEIRKNQNDSRSNVVYLTHKGREMKNDFIEISKKMFDIEYEGISDEEREVFTEVLNKIYCNFCRNK